MEAIESEAAVGSFYICHLVGGTHCPGLCPTLSAGRGARESRSSQVGSTVVRSWAVCADFAKLFSRRFSKRKNSRGELGHLNQPSTAAFCAAFFSIISLIQAELHWSINSCCSWVGQALSSRLVNQQQLLLCCGGGGGKDKRSPVDPEMNMGSQGLDSSERTHVPL